MPMSWRSRLPIAPLRAVAAAVAVSSVVAGGLTASVVAEARTVTAAKAATCYNASCDAQGPKASGCFEDDRAITWDNNAAGDRMITLKYSPSCHAFWAYSPNDPSYGTSTLELDIEQKNSRGVFEVVARRFEEQNAGDGADWTNAWGARTKNWRYRAIVTRPDGRVFQTVGALGGTQD